MKDSRVFKLASLLVNYSLRLKKGDTLIIEGSDATIPLIEAAYKEALKVGAHPDIRITLSSTKEQLLKVGTVDQLEHISPMEREGYENYDAHLIIWGDQNTKALSNVDTKNMSTHRAARKDIRMKFFKRLAENKTKWCGTQFPTHSDAQEASMSLAEYEDFVFGAGLLNEENPAEKWQDVSNEQQKICDYLDGKKGFRFVTKDTDITMSAHGRKWINCDGKENFPDGEVFTTPVRDSVNGTIRFTYPAIYSNREVEDVTLTFKDGKVIEASAEKGEDFLVSVLDTDEGARYLGEVAIGTNYGITYFSKNTLFDEKIGGTIHMAVGSGFEETGGTNESSVHWDMICDMKEEGKIYADDELIYEKGKFIVDFK